MNQSTYDELIRLLAQEPIDMHAVRAILATRSGISRKAYIALTELLARVHDTEEAYR